MQEFVDIVDELDNVVACVARRVMRAHKLRHRMVGVVVRSSTGDVLVHQRAANKDVWPSMWDVMVGGVVAAGETYETAARRELNEEIGVDAPLRFLMAGRFDDENVHENARVFTVTSDGPFAFTDNEVVDAYFVAAEALDDFVANFQVVPDSVHLLELMRLGRA